MHFGAVSSVWTSILILPLIESIDCLLKMAGTEKAVGIEVDLNSEFKLAGLTNLLLAPLVSAPGFHQTKFVVMNYNFLGRLDRKESGIIVAVLLSVVFMSGFPLLNYLPRFLLGGLLMFVGVDFVVDNLISCSKRLALPEYALVWVITALSVKFSFLTAIAAGLLLSILVFARRYAVISPVQSIQQGLDCPILRPEAEAQKLQQLGSQLCVVIQLKGFVFFGSASFIQEAVEECLRHLSDPKLPKSSRFVILNFQSVSNIDAAACDIFAKVARMAFRSKVHLLWAGMAEPLRVLILETKCAAEAACFVDVDAAKEWVQAQVLEFSHARTRLWLVTDSLKYMNAVARLNRALRWMSKADKGPDLDLGCLEPYWQLVRMQEGQVLCQAGVVPDALYCLQQGRAEAFVSTHEDQLQTRLWVALSGTYIKNYFWMGTPCPYTIVITEPSCLVVFSREALQRMEQAQPQTSLQLMHSLLRSLTTFSNSHLMREVQESTRPASPTETWSRGPGARTRRPSLAPTLGRAPSATQMETEYEAKPFS